MKKLLFTICILAGLQMAAQAQFSVSPHISPAFTTGDFNFVSDNAFGFGIEGAYDIDENFQIGLAVDHYKFSFEPAGLNLGNLFDFNLINFNMTPITANAKYILPTTSIQPYVGLEAGAYILGVSGAVNYDRTYFGLAPMAGLIVPVNDRFDIFANAKYESVFVNENINLLVNNLEVNQNIHYIPINIGITYKFDQ